MSANAFNKSIYLLGPMISAPVYMKLPKIIGCVNCHEAVEHCSDNSLIFFSTPLDGLLSLYQELGNAYVALSSYECKKSLSLFEAIQPQHYNTCWVLSQVARCHFELAQYHLVSIE